MPAAKAAEPVGRRARRVRVDVLLVERGMAQSRAAAQRLIAAGCVLANGVQVFRPSVELGRRTRAALHSGGIVNHVML